jgi:predicted enzyme related to lactoylglutathione lyase
VKKSGKLRTGDYLRRTTATLIATIIGLSVSPLQANEPGNVPWFDLVTENAEVAGDFYSDLFGWEIVISHTGSNLVMHNGIPIGGISEIEDSIQDVDESQWIPAIEVDDVARAVAAAIQAGGTVEHPTTREAGWLTYAVIKDAEHATVELVDTERPLGGNEGAGNWVWAELWTKDFDKAAAFYAEVVGYQQTIYEPDDRGYPVFEKSDDPKAGLVLISYEGIEAGWAPYIGIADMQDTLARAKELGGVIHLSPEEASDDGRVALLGDPVGAAFFVYELDKDAP